MEEIPFSVVEEILVLPRQFGQPNSLRASWKNGDLSAALLRQRRTLLDI
jgi:hypothetical protein